MTACPPWLERACLPLPPSLIMKTHPLSRSSPCLPACLTVTSAEAREGLKVGGQQGREKRGRFSLGDSDRRTARQQPAQAGWIGDWWAQQVVRPGAEGRPPLPGVMSRLARTGRGREKREGTSLGGLSQANRPSSGKPKLWWLKSLGRGPIG